MRKEAKYKETIRELQAQMVELQKEAEKMRLYNRTLLEKEQDASSATVDNTIHSFYQDLFLTDMKRDIQEANMEVGIRREEVQKVHQELTAIKKENAVLKKKLKMYRDMVQEIQSKNRAEKHENYTL